MPRARMLLPLALASLLTLALGQLSAQTSEPGDDNINIADSSVGYIDNAIPGSMARFRYDAGYNSNRPNRAEYFYAAKQPIGPGLPLGEISVDYQDVLAHLEAALDPRFSVFVELGTRFLNPELNANSAGLADSNAGFKWAFWYEPDRVATFQLRTYAPTGSATRGLGTRHVSIEPALLYYQRAGERLTLQGEFKYWVPAGGTPGFAGNILRYGAGVGYDVVDNGSWRVTPVMEFVGWTVLDGKAAGDIAPGVPFFEDAAGDTIVNLKLGNRVTFEQNKSLYVGWGRALTGERWYQDILRLEFRVLY